jgi:hypothetical protein
MSAIVCSDTERASMTCGLPPEPASSSVSDIRNELPLQAWLTESLVECRDIEATRGGEAAWADYFLRRMLQRV